jgi:hypothetical protein
MARGVQRLRSSNAFPGPKNMQDVLFVAATIAFFAAAFAYVRACDRV